MPNRAQPRDRNAATSVLAIALGPCGGGSNAATRTSTVQHERRLPLAVEENRLERGLVRPGDLLKARPGSVQRVLLEYWAALQNEEWTIALDYYPEQTQKRLGRGPLIAALHLEGATSTAVVKPLIRATRPARGNQTSIRYYIRRPDGTLRPTSIIWRRQGGRWYVAYSATLDDSYSSAVQQMVQDRIDPTVSTPSKEAVSAGRRALRAQADSFVRP